MICDAVIIYNPINWIHEVYKFNYDRCWRNLINNNWTVRDDHGEEWFVFASLPWPNVQIPNICGWNRF